MVQNRPQGIASYKILKNVFQVSCDCPEDQVISITIPDDVSPFSIANVYVNNVVTKDNPVELMPCDIFSIEFAVSTKNEGTFQQTLVFDISCDENNIQYSYQLNAEVVSANCGCPLGTDTTIIDFYDNNNDNLVQVNSSMDFQNLLFTNEFECDITIDSILIYDHYDSTVKEDIYKKLPVAGNEEWVLNSEYFGTIIEPGDDFIFDVKFTPLSACERASKLIKMYILLENGDTCIHYLKFMGRGCNDKCPEINGKEFGEELIKINLSAPFHPEGPCADFLGVSTRTSDNEELEITFPSCLCMGEQATLTTKITDDENGLSAQFFSVNPSGAQLDASNGQSEYKLTVTFYSPTESDFNDLFPPRTWHNPPTAEDSTMRAKIVIKVGDCEQIIEVTAKVENIPQLSDPLRLYPYNQHTDSKPTPDYQVCYINSNNVDVGTLRKIADDKVYAPQKPNDGSFYINVDDTTRESINSEQVPELYLTDVDACGKYLKLVARGYNEEDFDNMDDILAKLKNDVTAEGAESYFYNGSNIFQPVNHPNGYADLQPKDVYAIYSEGHDDNYKPCCLALIYIANVISDGNLNPTNHRSSIDFRVLSPVIP